MVSAKKLRRNKMLLADAQNILNAIRETLESFGITPTADVDLPDQLHSLLSQRASGPPAPAQVQLPPPPLSGHGQIASRSVFLLPDFTTPASTPQAHGAVPIPLSAGEISPELVQQVEAKFRSNVERAAAGEIRLPNNAPTNPPQPGPRPTRAGRPTPEQQRQILENALGRPIAEPQPSPHVKPPSL